MADLKRFTGFTSLKLASKSKQESNIIKPEKVKELEKFFELLKANLSIKKVL
jgi:hypothetical protein